MVKTIKEFKDEVKMIRMEMYKKGEYADTKLIASWLDRLCISLEKISSTLDLMMVELEELSESNGGGKVAKTSKKKPKKAAKKKVMKKAKKKVTKKSRKKRRR